MSSVATLAVAVPLLAAAILIGGGRYLPRLALLVVSLTAGVAVIVMCALLVVDARSGLIIHWFGGWKPTHGLALGVAFVVDTFGAAAGVLAGVLTVAAVVVAWSSDEFGALASGLIMTVLAAAVGFSLTGDLFNLFVFFELMSVSMFALTALHNTRVGSLQGALQFAVSNSIGAFFILIGIALLYARTGALNLAQIGETLAARPPDRLVGMAFALILVGFLIKAAIVPFHFWLADAATAAPPAVGMLLVGVLDALGLYAIARVYWTAFSGTVPQLPALRPTLLVAGAVTALLGAAMCLAQQRLTRLLAFAAISHSGLMLIGIGLLNPRGLAGFGIYACADGTTKAALFGLGAVLDDPADGQSRARQRLGRAATLLLGVAGLALAGLPPFGTALGKGLIEGGTSGVQGLLLTGVFLVASIATGAAVLRAGARSWRPRRATPRPNGELVTSPPPLSPRRPTLAYAAAASGGLLVIAFALGLAPGLAQRSVAAASRFTDRAVYARGVLFGAPHVATRFIAVGFGLRSVLVGLLSAAGAVTLAVMATSDHRLVAAVRSSLQVPVRRLRRLHTGRIGDSITWLTLGTAVIGTALTLTLR